MFFIILRTFISMQIVPNATYSVFRISFPLRKDPLFQYRTLVSHANR